LKGGARRAWRILVQKVGIAEKQRSYEIESLFVFICARINIQDSEHFQ
jgi:hypothetical protein